MSVEPRLRVLSFGAGVQTTALAILNARGEIADPARDLVFADTGDEKPETMAYLQEHFLPWAESHGLVLHTVRPKGGSLYDTAYRRRMVPSIFTRWCTTEAKIRPINRWLHEQGASRATPADMQVGISADESHRAVQRRLPLFVRRRWPLCDLRLTRADCHAIIRDAGLPDPPKSGCWYCPYQARAGWQRLAFEHPDLAEKALALEANARTRNPRDILGGSIALKDLLSGAIQTNFDSLLEADEGCTSGACFV